VINLGTGFASPAPLTPNPASLAFTGPAKVLQSTYAFAAELADGNKYPYHYQCSYNTDHQGEAAVRHVADTLKIRKIGILQENTAFGEQATAASVAALKRRGIGPVIAAMFIAAWDIFTASRQHAENDGSIR